MVRKGAKTQKRRSKTASKSKSAMGIPELRKSLDYISDYTNSLVKSGSKVTNEMAADFAKEWRKVFDKSMSLSSAKQYLESVMKTSKGTKQTRRRQHGGAYQARVNTMHGGAYHARVNTMHGGAYHARVNTMHGGAQDTTLTGAPLNHLTRPGVDIPYGKFLPYVEGGFWNPEQAPAADCATFKPVLPSAGLGSNSMKGGGFLDTISNAFSAGSFRPFIAQNPTTPQFDAQTAWKGQSLGPGPESWQQAWKPMMNSSPNPLPQIQSYVRDVTADVRTR